MSTAKKYRISWGTYAYLQMHTPEKIMRAKGVDPQGDVQKFFTATVLRRIKRYMPKDTGLFIKTMIVQTTIDRPYIICDTPFAKYLFYGKVMRPIQPGYGPSKTDQGEWRYRKGAQLKPIDKPLTYDTTKNAKAGPRWDQRLSSAEGAAMAAEVTGYIKRRG